jgi:nucleoid-associated protein YgaU
MRITNLHLIVSFLFLSGLGVASYRFLGAGRSLTPFGLSATSTPIPTVTPEVRRDLDAARLRREEERARSESARLAAESALARALAAVESAEAQGRDASEARRQYDEAARLMGSAVTPEDFASLQSRADAAADTALGSPAAKVDRYVVRRGDNLWNISKRADVYGRGAGWVKIWRANEKKVVDFDRIVSGQELVIPR